MGTRLTGASILVIEDEYLLAMDTERMLRDVGAHVIGPAPSCGQALALLDSDVAIDAALVDVNLGGEIAFPVIDALLARSIRLILTTGYGAEVLEGRYPHVARFDKPLETSALLKELSSLISDAKPEP